tara:strand:+ start:1266 stop:1700 length:435 start_codon:yes stop_codon:yes gene_type:complete
MTDVVINPGFIVNPGMLDTSSENAMAVYGQQPIGNAVVPLPTVVQSVIDAEGKEVPVPISIMASTPYPPAQVTIPKTILPPPQPIPREQLVPTGNTTVFFQGQRVTVSGDQLRASAAVPQLRTIFKNDLTSQTAYPTIIIGTRV